jgi:hypothetical protein
VHMIKAKSFHVRTMLMLALGCAAMSGAACGGDDSAPPGDTPDNTCGGITGKGCGQGKFCHFEKGTCGQGDILGSCMAIPTVCEQDCLQVCGCDAKSYCNACIAHMAGVDDADNMSCDNTPPS